MSAEQKGGQERMLQTIKKHEKLIDLAKKLNSLGKITEVIFTNLSEVVNPEEKVLICYYQLQTSEKVFEGKSQPEFYSCELNILTNKNYINMGFFQTAHTLNVKQINHISEIDIQTMFGNQYDVDSELGAAENSYQPSQIKIRLSLSNSNHEKVASWEIDTTDERNIELILPQVKSLAGFIGVPLSQINK